MPDIVEVRDIIAGPATQVVEGVAAERVARRSPVQNLEVLADVIATKRAGVGAVLCELRQHPGRDFGNETSKVRKMVFSCVGTCHTKLKQVPDEIRRFDKVHSRLFYVHGKESWHILFWGIENRVFPISSASCSKSLTLQPQIQKYQRGCRRSVHLVDTCRKYRRDL